MLKLRPHHLLCLSLFEGKGYDHSFAQNMADVLKRLANEGSFTLAEGRDDICTACPNLAGDSLCALGEADVRRMDRAVAEFLKLELNNQYESKLVNQMMKDRMTEELFLSCCGSCRWYREKICSYQKLVERLHSEL